jgi:flagellar motor switch protein FliM
MSGDVLSQDHVAALVAAAKEGQIPESAPARPGRRARRVRDVDFRRPSKFTQEQQRRLERSHDGFCRSASTHLSAELRMAIELEVINSEQLTWADALADIPPQSLYAILRSPELDTQFLIGAELSLVQRLIERLTGGPGTTKPEPRPLTEIELSLSRRILATLIDQLAQTWREVFDVGLELESLETLAQNLQLQPPGEPTLTLTIESRFERVSQTISMLVPYRSIESVAGRLTSQYAELRGEAVFDPVVAETVRESVSGVDVELRVEVAAVEMTIAQLLELQEGDLVRFGVPARAGVIVCADRSRIHRARPGRNGQRRAVEILERLEEGP